MNSTSLENLDSGNYAVMNEQGMAFDIIQLFVFILIGSRTNQSFGFCPRFRLGTFTGDSSMNVKGAHQVSGGDTGPNL